MKISRVVCAWAFGFVALVGLPQAASAQTCFFVGGAPDGRIVGPYLLSSASDDATFAWDVEPGRSYSVEAITQRGPSGGGALSATLNINTTFCPNTDVAPAAATIRNTNTLAPAALGNVRRSVVTLTAAGALEMRLHNLDTTGSSVLLSVSETTMFSPAWSTNSTFNTYYSFQNTTSASCNVTLTLSNQAGAVQSTFNGTVANGATLATNTVALATPRGTTGTARLTHDCPPNTIVAEADIANFTLPSPYIQIVKFQQRFGH